MGAGHVSRDSPTDVDSGLHRPCAVSGDRRQEELRFLGIRSSASFVAEPECNGVAERFVKTLKEQCLWLHTFDTVDDVNAALATFKETYNHGWMVAKYANRSPVEARQHLAARAAA